jgi:hypothetical protein
MWCSLFFSRFTRLKEDKTMANQKRGQKQYEWLTLAQEAALEMDKSGERNFQKAEHILLHALELLAADKSYPADHRCIDQALIVSTLAFAYVGQGQLSLGCMIADEVVSSACQKWPAHIDGNLVVWRAVLLKMQQLYLATGQDDKALDLAVDRLDKVNELADMLMYEPSDFPGCEAWVAEAVPQSQNAVLQIRMQRLQTRENFERVKALLMAS